MQFFPSLTSSTPIICLFQSDSICFQGAFYRNLVFTMEFNFTVEFTFSLKPFLRLSQSVKIPPLLRWNFNLSLFKSFVNGLFAVHFSILYSGFNIVYLLIIIDPIYCLLLIKIFFPRIGTKISSYITVG